MTNQQMKSIGIKGIQQSEIPKAAKGQVLIKVQRCSMKQWGSMQNGCLAMQGIGTVISGGGGALSWRLDGKTVSFISLTRQNCLQQYIVCSAKTCSPLQLPTSNFFLLYPMTSLMITDHTDLGVVHTASDLQFCNSFHKFCIKKKIPCISIVQTDNEKTELQIVGTEVLSMESPGFEEEFKSRVKSGMQMVDGKGGELQARVLGLMPDNSICYLYDARKPLGKLDPSLFFKDCKEIRGLSLQKWFNNLSMTKRYSMMSSVKSNQDCFVPINLQIFSPQHYEKACKIQSSLSSVIIDISDISQITIEQQKHTPQLQHFLAEYQTSKVIKTLQIKQEFQWDSEFLVQDYPIFMLQDYSIYRGETENQLPNGRGIRYYPNKTVYTGYWKQGQKHGHGRVLQKHQSYDGQWRLGLKHGQGILLLQNGNKYKGVFQENILIRGKQTTESEVYIGEFCNLERHGQGVLTFANGNVFNGTFNKGKIQGMGKITYFDGKLFQGSFETVDGDVLGQGLMKYLDDSKFHGKMVNWVEAGEGIYADPD